MSTIPQRIATVDSILKANEFVSLARCVASTRSSVEAQRLAQRLGCGTRVTEALQQKAAQPAGVTYDSAWGGALVYAELSDAFGESLRNISVFDRALPDTLRAPIKGKVIIITAGATAATVAEAGPKPASALSTTTADLEPSKISAYIVLTEELLRPIGSGPTQLIGRELRKALAAQTDSFFVSRLTTGISAVAASGSNTASGIREDLRALLEAVVIGPDARLFFVSNSLSAKRLSILGDVNGAQALVGMSPVGGTLFGIPFVISDAVSSGQVVLFDASQIATGTGLIELDQSGVASLQLDTTPDSPPLISSAYTNLWQSNARALRAERFLSVTRLRSTAVAHLSGFGGASP